MYKKLLLSVVILGILLWNFQSCVTQQVSDNQLLDSVQQRTLSYFTEFAHPICGLAVERSDETIYSNNVVTTGGTGFGIMAMIAGVERGFLSRQQALDQLFKITAFLDTCNRYHGVWSHWYFGDSGKTKAFSPKDNGGDIVETAFLVQGLLSARQYFNESNTREQALRTHINKLWEEVEWNWYTNNTDSLYWHWSPDFNFEMNHTIRGWNECLITYVLAASSPTHPIPASMYHQNWTQSDHFFNGKKYYNIELPLGYAYGGPLFFAHYSFLGLDPRGLYDKYANYWEQNVNHTLINRQYCIENPKKYTGYSEDCWGLSASDNYKGYAAHSPSNDMGVITPTAALSSFPYTPEYSMKALKYFYYKLGPKIWKAYGFTDAFSVHNNWYASNYLAIDQGPIVVMIENYRSGLLWNTFMSCNEIQEGLIKLGFMVDGQQKDAIINNQKSHK